jgi:hypothetical protein
MVPCLEKVNMTTEKQNGRWVVFSSIFDGIVFETFDGKFYRKQGSGGVQVAGFDAPEGVVSGSPREFTLSEQVLIRVKKNS